MKTIIITGASSGIGKATAELLAKDKHNLILIARNKQALDEIAKNNKNCHVFQCDLTNEEQVEETSNKIIKDFKIDVLINNAGVGFPTKLDELSLEDYNKMIDTNVKGLVFFTKNILHQMKNNNKGHIINISSPAGLSANPIAPIYCASKFALEGYSEGLKLQLKDEKKNIRVTIVRPGAVNTNYWGKREVEREKFMIPKEMALVIKFVIDFPEQSNIVEITMESVRF
jgi:short-subunit dehydrogenase